jgi:hypothetical protein
MQVERTFAWEDTFKRLLLRFERIEQRHYGMQWMAYTMTQARSAQTATATPKDGRRLQTVRQSLPPILAHIPPSLLTSGSG